MQFTTTVANSLWAASSLPAYMRFREALQEPQLTQRKKLRHLLKINAQTGFGKAHRFDKISTYEEFTRAVPLSDYAAFEPSISRIRQGGQRILTAEPVTHLIPTSGSTAARKLIPFTAGLQREFNAAISPWITCLFRQSPGMMNGPAYWSITPAMRDDPSETSAIPIGFDADTAYLGGHRRRLADAVMAVPPSVARAKSLDQFRFQTLLHLLQCEDLRLISVWHPSFLLLLLDALPHSWERLLGAIECGSASTPARPRRALELRHANPLLPTTLWPSLRLISCWGDAAAALSLEQLRFRFPTVLVQPKGLVATEAFVSLPFAGQYPVAVTSHFFEFIDFRNQVHPVESLEANAEYEVVVTTAGGLWRYRLGDRVRVTGFVRRTPSLKFIGRGDAVSDRFGEKLNETFVAETLRELFGSDIPRFALLAPDGDDTGCSYTLYLEGSPRPDWPDALDRALRRNPHYAHCRDLGQLQPVRVFLISGNGYDTFARRQGARGARLGEIKPAALSRSSGWTTAFAGMYLDAQSQQS